MKSYRLRIVLLLATVAVFLAAAVGRNFHASPSASAQSTDQLGTSSARAADQDITLDKNESVDKDSIEKNPTAPDDTADSTATTTSANSTAANSATTTTTTKVYQIPVPLPGGLDYAANGVGTRNAGFGTIRLRGIPPGAVAVRATLYWGEIRAGLAVPLTETVSFKGVAVTGNLLGTCPAPCWPGNFFAAYGASVIALLNPGLNSDYLVAKLPSSLTDGRDPWLTAPVPAPNPLSEGASLVVIYAHPSVPVAARVITHPVVQLTFGTLTVSHALGVPLPAYGTMKHTRLGADGQVGSSTFPINFATDERTFIGPNALALTQIKGPGSPFNVNTDWDGNDGLPLNQLWDTQTSSSGAIIPAGSVAYTVRYVSHGDCIVPVIHVLGVK